MNENLAVRIHRKVVMGRRVRQLSSHLTNLIPNEVVSILDVGAGTGEIAQAVSTLRPKLNIQGVDTYIRPKTFVKVTLYDGETLPFEDESIDLVMIVDVLHHCQNPEAVLKECGRVSKRWVLVKDHVSDGLFDRLRLRFMDWVGNRAHGVVLPYNYLSTKQWDMAFNYAGLRKASSVNNIMLYPYILDHLFGKKLHCMCLLVKE